MHDTPGISRHPSITTFLLKGRMMRPLLFDEHVSIFPGASRLPRVPAAIITSMVKVFILDKQPEIS